MRRTTLLLTVALVVALMMAIAGPALATVHPLSNSECSGLDENTVAGSQDPPGLTGQSNENADNFAQPILSVEAAQGEDSPAFKQEPVPGSDPFCPAEN